MPHRKILSHPLDFLGSVLAFDRPLPVVLPTAPSGAVPPSAPTRPAHAVTHHGSCSLRGHCLSHHRPQKGPPDPPLQTPLLLPLITMRSLSHEELNLSSCYLFQFSHGGKLLPVNIAKMSLPHMRNMKEDELPFSDFILHCLSPLPFSPSI